MKCHCRTRITPRIAALWRKRELCIRKAIRAFASARIDDGRVHHLAAAAYASDIANALTVWPKKRKP
jgi:hypothetical protein